jgi:septum formation protein
MNMNQHYLLASTSPRRKELLELLGLSFSVIASNVDEVFDESIPIEEAIMELAYQKALAVFRHHKEEIVLGFDTDVVVDGVILGKPKDAEDAKRMLRMLSDKTHVVVTGGAILSKAVSTSFYEKARVTFFPMDDSEIDTYIATGEPFDKAGAYAVQGFGARYIKSIQGDFYTIMGLPVARLYHELKRLGL